MGVERENKHMVRGVVVCVEYHPRRNFNKQFYFFEVVITN